MCKNLWNNINIKEVPSLAFKKYIKAFKYENKDGTIRDYNNIERINFREKVLNQLSIALSNPEECVINTKTLMPHNIIEKMLDDCNSYSDIESYNALWNKYMSDFSNKFKEGVFPPGVVLADVSPSMSGTPMSVCIALSIMLSELFVGPFKNKVITFETTPKWHNISGDLLTDKILSLIKTPWGGTTNFKRALEMILSVGTNNKLSNDDMPKVLYVFSDMQWDSADYNHCGFESIEKSYKKHNYKMPHIVFWNLRNTNTFNNKSNQKGTTMMSGYSPNLFKAFLNGNFIESTPWNTLKDLLDSDRYNFINDKIDTFVNI